MAAESLTVAAPLKHQSMLFVIGNLQDLNIQQLSLLPVTVKRDILLSLPVVDVQRLENNTPFMKDIDMNNVWKTLFECRIPKNMQTALLDLLRRQEIDGTGLDLSWKEQFLLCCFDTATASKFYRQANCVIYLFEIIMFCVDKNDLPWFKCLPNNFKSLFNLKSSKLIGTLKESITVSRLVNTGLYTTLLSPMPPPAQQQGQLQHSSLAQPVEKFVNIALVMKFLQSFFQFRPRILLLHNVTILDITQNILWPTAHISGITTANMTAMLADFLQDVQMVCMRSRGWNPAKNLSVLRTIFQILVSNKKKMLTGIVLDLLNIGIPAQNQILAVVSSCLTGLILTPHQAHVRATRQSPYDSLTTFSVYFALEAADEIKHINTIIRSQLQLEIAKVNCNIKTIAFEPRPFVTEVYSSLFESCTMIAFTNPSLKQLELSQVTVHSSIFMNLLFHFLTSTCNTEQLLSISCMGIVQFPVKSKVPVCRSESANDAGRHGPRSLKLHLCHFSPEVYDWLCGFPKIILKSLELISTDVTDNLSALMSLSKLDNLQVTDISVSAISSQDLWHPLAALLTKNLSSKLKLTASLTIRNISKEHVNHLVDILQSNTRVFVKLFFVLSAPLVKDIDQFNSLLKALFSLPYRNSLILGVVSPGFRRHHILNIIHGWEAIGNKERFRSLTIIGDSTVSLSNLPFELRESLYSMATHYCDTDQCGCMIRQQK